RPREQVVVDRHLADGALEPGVAGHRSDVDGTSVGFGRHVVLAHAARVAVVGVVPLHAVHPDVDRTGRRRTVRRLAPRRVFAYDVIPTGGFDEPAHRLPIGCRTVARARVEYVGGDSIAAPLRVGRVVHASFPLAGRRVVRALAHPVHVAIRADRELE